MKKTLLIITLISMFVITGSSAAIIAFAEIAPIHPEDKLFNFQNTVEHTLLFLYPDPISKSWYELKILEKRTDDLESVEGLPEEVQRINAVWIELDHVLRQFQMNGSDEDQNLKLRLAKILNKIDEELKQFSYFADQNPSEFLQSQEKIIRLRNLVLDPANSLAKLYDLSQVPQVDRVKVSSLTPLQPILTKQIEPHKIPFLPGSAGAEHKFFLLTGKHAELTCEGCHSGLTYAGLPDQCIDCHLSVLPVEHYEGVCTLCHTTDGWVPANFDHSLSIAVDCVSCHLINKP
ncbi:MAG TPA: hypothetical protein VK856_13710, partial [Anaerolineaceae bacterium]|nr:hypothetical protein [Anaerolineaceae bacterium]